MSDDGDKRSLNRDEAKAAVDNMIKENPQKIVISNRRFRESADGLRTGTEEGQQTGSRADHVSVPQADDICGKIVISPKLIGGVLKYQAEKFTETQVFHDNMEKKAVAEYIVSFLERGFRQVNAFTAETEFSMRISKKGKILTGKNSRSVSRKKAVQEIRRKIPDIGPEYRKATGQDSDTGGRKNTENYGIQYNVTACGYGQATDGSEKTADGIPQHNRKKKRLIEEGTAVAPLTDMGIFTEEGKIVKSMGDKFRQINRFLEIVDDAVDACGFEEIHIVDFGCGKAYLTFILYYYLTFVKKIRAYMTGLDLKADVIGKCRKAAEKYGYENLRFEVGDIGVYESDEPVDMVITLHACDTATDYALMHAMEWNSRVILSVPCCQHEMNGQIEGGNLSLLTKYGLLKERFSALATDAVRASLLEYMGYKTQVLEFVDFSHTPKNVMIRAVKTHIPKAKREKSLQEVEELMREFHVKPALYRLLAEKEVIS